MKFCIDGRGRDWEGCYMNKVGLLNSAVNLLFDPNSNELIKKKVFLIIMFG